MVKNIRVKNVGEGHSINSIMSQGMCRNKLVKGSGRVIWGQLISNSLI